MSLSLQQKPKLAVRRLPELQRQNPTPVTRRRQSRFVTGKAILLAVLVILLVQGCVGAAPPAALVTLAEVGAAENTGGTTHARLPAPPILRAPTATPVSDVGSDLVPADLPPPAGQPTADSAPAPAAIDQAGIKYVVIISIDGLRPDALAQAATPTLDSLIARGAYSPNAQSIRISETLPGHASMLSGMTPEKHGVMWGLPYIGWPGMNGPTLFTVAHDAGFRTAMAYGKEKLDYLVVPNSVDQRFRADAHDAEVKERAVEFIEAGLPGVLFVHLPDVDRVGHAHGWLSTNQLYAIEYADGMVGEIVAALEREGYLKSTFLIVTSDHGGHGRRHGDDSPEDRTIPWLAVGPGVKEGVTIPRHINIYDTAATALYALGLPVPEVWDGQPILEIFSDTR